MIFKGLMTRAPQYNAIWAVLHPIHGLLLYTAVLGAVQPPKSRRAFRPLHALPVSILFGLYNVMKSGCGKGTGVPGIVVHLTDQLEPLAVMCLSLATGARRSFPSTQWAGAACLLLASSWYIFGDAAAALDVKSHSQLGLCVAKNVPLAAAFMYVEWIVKTAFPCLFPTVLWWWVCLFQMFTTLVPAYYQFNPEDVDGLSFVSFLRSGVACYWLGTPEATCSGMPIGNAGVVIFGGMMNLAMPVIARHGGAPMMMVRAASLPFVAFLFTCPSLVGDRAEDLDTQRCLSLLLAALALLLWASSSLPPRSRGA
mmetsp:Transcript_22508/g.46692  ORF Transcript_22508/g.46692 Transcript_22508/m.46692 type:complete len:311 (+) Transcript_22508:3-935(+)